MHTTCLRKRLFYGLMLAITSVTCAHAVTLSSTGDAYVRSGSNATYNYGGAPDLALKLGLPGDNFNRETYIRFDLTSVTAPITTAKLRLYGTANTTGVSAAVYGLISPTTAWTEGSGNGTAVTGINWNNKPVASTTSQATTVVSAIPAWNEWSLGTYLAAEKAAGRNVVTLVVKATVSNTAGLGFNSRTATSNQPQLEIGSWTAVNETAPQITYTGYWNSHVDGFKESSESNATAEMTFTGTGIRYYAKTASFLNGQIEITIDGVVQATVSNTGSAVNNETLLYENTGLSNATHTISVRKISGNYISVAKFDYLNDGSTPAGASITSPTGLPSNSGYILPDALVTVAANATNATSVKLQLDGVDVPGAVDTSAPYSFTWDASLVPVGPHTLRAVASNASGSMTSPAIPVLIELFAGVNTHVGQGQNSTNLLNLTVEAGANFVRDGAGWSVMETTQGTYNWTNSWGSNVESYITQANAAGVRGMWGLGNENSFYTSPWIDNTTVGRTGFGNYGKSVAQRFAINNNLRIVGILNEPTGNYCGVDQDGDGDKYDDNTAARYYEIIKAAYPKIKEGNPSAIVAGPVTMLAKWFDLNFLTALQQAGGATYIDWLDVHTYIPVAQNDPARRLESMTRWLKDNVQPLFPTKPILVSEYGYSSPDGDPVCTQLKKAEELARTYMSIRTVPNIRGLVWYQLNDDYNRHGLCLKSTEGYARQEAFYTFQDVAPIFRRAAYYGRGTIATNVWLVKFKDTTGDFYAAWREEDGASNLAFSFTASAPGSLQVREVKTTSTIPANTAYAFATGGNTVSIPLTTRVKFIRVPSGLTLTPSASYGFSANPIP